MIPSPFVAILESYLSDRLLRIKQDAEYPTLREIRANVPQDSILSPMLLCRNTTRGSHFAIVIHGWRESCKEKWVQTLIEKLTTHRGGCIMCMDYGFIARIPHYFMLAKHVHKIAWMLTHQLNQLEHKGFIPEQGFIFGFSLGGRIAIEAGRLFGSGRIGEIDTCDMAGPGFDLHGPPDSKEAALNVQCIHTSSDKGTKTRDCHQNWNMGNCGRTQVAAGNPPLGSHGLCPTFYNAAFDHPFYAEEFPKQCNITGKKVKRFWPKWFRMGYMESRKLQVHGTFYSSTTENYPYTTNAAKKYQGPLTRADRIEVDSHTNVYLIEKYLHIVLTRNAAVIFSGLDITKNLFPISRGSN
ncbi:uncharacterized protein LOC129613896 [Condylostylus longicornis]|uniref:uncharacterized protein LOC129613896 n=1 Tax=Condylostylus longicornis TaxID=2530218 RepID=UPI00244E148F|nr:uncharacterized protein LOC129613896 [Condylostylus longicornis]